MYNRNSAEKKNAKHQIKSQAGSTGNKTGTKLPASHFD